MMEGGQGCLVGLKPIDKERYKTSHPRSYQNTLIAHKGPADDNNMERLIVGRQFLVVLVVFVSNVVASAVPTIDTLLGLPEQVLTIFLRSGVALILVTVTIGQLTAQVNAANCMLDFINNSFMLYFVTYISLAIEFSGLLHCVYLVPFLLSKWTKSSTTKNNNTQDAQGSSGAASTDEECPPCNTTNPSPSLEDATTTRTALQRCFFWGRIGFSLSILILAFAVTLDALFAGQTTMWDGIPAIVSVIIFFVLMAFVGIMDGMQIALFAVVNLLPKQEESIRQQYPWAYKSCQVTFDKTQNNLQAFLIGRQICVTIGMFVVARVTTLNVEIKADGDNSDNIFGVPNGIQQFFNTGLLGAMITTIVASLLWRVVASAFPLAYLNNPIMYGIIRLCLIVEQSGICSSAWILASVHKNLAGLQPDQVYLEDNNDTTTTNTNHHEDDALCGMKRPTLEPCATGTFSECDTVATPMDTPTRK
jgi:hypothetical protein